MMTDIEQCHYVVNLRADGAVGACQLKPAHGEPHVLHEIMADLRRPRARWRLSPVKWGRPTRHPRRRPQ